MTLLPIAVRELRVASRRRSMYVGRATTAFTATALICYLLYVFRQSVAAQTGAFLFNFLVSLCSIVCLTMVTITSDCVSEEKRENTLGLLFLTDLKGYDVTLGKLFSRSLVLFYSILGILPVVAVSYLFGGVTSIEFWQAALGILNLFFFSQATGLFVSTLNEKHRSAAFWAAIIVGVYTMGFYLIPIALRGTRFRQWAEPFEWMNPTYPIYYACASGSLPLTAFARKFGHYWQSLLLVHANAWLLLALASWWMPRCWQDRPVKPKIGRLARLRRWYDAKCVPRARLLDASPFLWLSVRNKFGSAKLWMTLFVFTAVWLGFLFKYGFRDAGIPMCILALIVNHLLVKIFLAAEAAGNMEEQRRSGGLEFLLACTPLKVEEIISGQWSALRRLFLGPIIGVLVADLVYLFIVAPKVDSTDGRGGFIFFVLGSMAMLALDYIALGWVGMWKAMIHRKTRGRAARATIAQILGLPWLIFLLLGSMIASSGGSGIHGADFLAIWFAIGLFTDLISAGLARTKLSEEFRERAAVHGEEPLGFLGKLGRTLGLMARR